MSPFNILFGQGSADDAARALYTAAVRQARLPDFYTELEVADSLDGRFDLLALHVFLVLNRLGRQGRDAKPLSQAVFDLMFTDMEGNLREMGVSDLAVGNKVKAMAKAFYGRIAAYEPGLDNEAILQEALARNLYRGQATGAAPLSRMASYTIRTAQALASQSFDALKRGRVTFLRPLEE